MKANHDQIHILLIVGLLAFSLLPGCNSPSIPQTLGEKNSGYTYIPIDPLPVSDVPGNSCIGCAECDMKPILDALPDLTVRLAVAQIDRSGKISYGPVSVGSKGSSYKVILDYVNSDVTQVPVYVKRVLRKDPKKEISLYDIAKDSTNYKIEAIPFSTYKDPLFVPDRSKGSLVVFPVYLGVGLRLTATVKILKANANLSGLGALAAEAEAGKLSGSMVIQTLGITGKSVTNSLPLPSQINQTTIQNAILALGSIKAILYDTASVEIEPRAVGIYNPIGGGPEVVNGVISSLINERVKWHRPCVDQCEKE